jgi:hypothetical protein
MRSLRSIRPARFVTVLYRQAASDDTVRQFRSYLPVLRIAFGSVIAWCVCSLQIQATGHERRL